MGSWQEYNFPMVPGVPEAMDAAGEAAGTLSGLLDVLAGLLDTLSSLVSMMSDPVIVVYALPRSGREALFQVSFVPLGEEWTSRVNLVWGANAGSQDV